MSEPERYVENTALGLRYKLYGVAPVQAEGWITGKPFYFRARGNEWSFSVATSGDADPVEVESDADGFYREGQYGKRYQASYLPFDVAETIILDCVGEYLREVAA